MKSDEYGDGTITKLESDKTRARCRKWIICVWADGKRHRHRFSGTYTQAVDERDRFAASLAEQTLASEVETVSLPTFREYADEWQSLRESSHEISRTTIVKTGRVVEMLEGLFGDIPLDAIDPLTIKRNLDALRNGGAPSGKILSGTYMNTIYIVLKAIFSSAVDDELLARNPCAKLKAPRRDTEERKALPLDDLMAFLALLDTQPLDPHTIALRLAVMGGLRRGETVGTVKILSQIS